MNRQSQSALRPGLALAMVLALVLSVLLGAPLARAQDAGDDTQSSVRDVENAEFRWGVNKQSSGPSHGPGVNFFAAGTSPSGTITKDTWKGNAGNVFIEKRTSASAAQCTDWNGTQTDQSGVAMRDAKSSGYGGLEVVFTGGQGAVNPEEGKAEIKWSGTATILYYSGLVNLTVSNPILTVTPSSAKITATMGGLKSSQENPEKSEPIKSVSDVTIADLPRGSLNLGGETGFSIDSDYKRVTYNDPTGLTPQSQEGANWGAFPASFMKFAHDAGSAGFWYSTKQNENDAKVPLPVFVGWDADDSAANREACSSPPGSDADGILGQVIDETVEDILRSAGTDVSDTAAAWLDEAWKPLQPGASNDVQAGGGDASAPTANLEGEMVVDEEFAYEYEASYSAETPMTAGTVGAVVAASPATSSGGSVRNSSAAAPASAPVTDQGTMPVAANLPLTDVVYSNTSASSDAGNALPQWQWWVGGVLLALAAGLFYQAVLRKD